MGKFEINENQYGQLTMAIVEEAMRRKIPCIPVKDSPVIQLGYGASQQRIQKSFTTFTGIIGVKQSSNKDLTKTILHSMGVPVPVGKVIYEANELTEAIKAVGFPMVIKPLSGNNGRGVSVNIRNVEDALRAFVLAQSISKSGWVIVEKYITGFDYRLLVINGKFIAAAKRTPAMVVGDGHSTLKELIDRVNSEPRRGEGHTKPLTIIKVDAATKNILKEKGLTLNSILADQEPLLLKAIANLSAGGTSTDVTDLVHPDNILTAERITKIIGLDVCGLDIISPDISIPFGDNNAAVVEVNSAPGFRLHIEPTDGKPRNVAAPVMDMLFPPGTSPLIPIIAVAGAEGTALACSLIEAALSQNGAHVGCATSIGISIQNVRLPCKGLNYHDRVELVLKDPTVNAAVFECTLPEIFKNGLAFPNCDVGIVNNLDGDLAEGAMEKAIAALTNSIFPTGYAILNADEVKVNEIKKRVKCNIALFSLAGNSPEIIKHIENGGYAAFIENGYYTVYNGLEKLSVSRAANETEDIFFKQAVLSSILFAAIYKLSIKSIPVSLSLPTVDGNDENGALAWSVQMGISYLINCIKADGSFIYEIDAKTGVIANSYNILRHAGSLYVLYQWFAKNKEDDRANNRLNLAASYLKRQVRPLKSHPNLSCVVEKNKVKLGGSALALLALIEKYKIGPSGEELILMKGLAGFLVWMQENSGKFKSTFYYREGNFTGFESTYYPGEAILALTNFYEVDPNPLWLNTAKMGIAYLISNPVKNPDGSYGHNHWLATALSAFYLVHQDINIYNELWRITNATIKEIENNNDYPLFGFTNIFSIFV